MMTLDEYIVILQDQYPLELGSSVIWDDQFEAWVECESES